MNKVASKLHSVEVPTKPMSQIGIDLCSLTESKEGFVGMVIAVDYFTKYVIAKPMPNKTAYIVAKFLFESVYTKYGVPSIQINDQGREFVSEVSRILHTMCGVQQRITSAYHPQVNRLCLNTVFVIVLTTFFFQANGLVERNNRTIQSAFLKVLEEHTDWPSALDGVVFAFNTAKQSSTGYTPFFLLHGWEARTITEIMAEGLVPLGEVPPGECDMHAHGDLSADMDAIRGHANHLLEVRKFIEDAAHKNIQKAQERQRDEYNKRHCGKVNFSIGDKVLLYNLKRKDRKGGNDAFLYSGPYSIEKKYFNGTFSLKNINGKILKSKAHGKNLKLLREPKFSKSTCADATHTETMMSQS